MNLNEFAQAVESTTAKIDRLTKDLEESVNGANATRDRLVELEEELHERRREYDLRKATLLINGVITGKNAEIREAELLMQMRDEQAAVDTASMKRMLYVNDLKSAEDYCAMLTAKLQAAQDYLRFLASPAAMIIAVEAEKAAYEQAISNNLNHLQKEVEHQMAENGNADSGRGTEGVFVHIMERDEHDEGEQDLFARPPYRPEHNDE